MSKRESFRSLRLAALLVVSAFVTGVIGYRVIEGFSWLDAIYMTTSIITTEGHVEQRLSDGGKMFTALLMVLGVASIFYTFGVFMEYALEGHLGLALRSRQMGNKISSLRGHAIICGFGRGGSQIAEDFASAGTPFVVIDEQESSVQGCVERGYLAIRGDATSDRVLTEAGICRARSLLVATENDAHNISITLSARHLSKEVLIVARANRNDTDVKLKLAGADKVLSPYTIGGQQMANMALSQDLAVLRDSRRTRPGE